MKVLSSVFGVFVLLSSTAAQVPTPSADLDDPAILETFVDAVATTHMKANHSPSGVVVIVKDGQRILARGYGYQNVDENVSVDPETTLFRPGSISKLFTWISIMQLVEQGVLDLDADVNEYLDTFQIRDTWPGRPVTLRHILTHSAGFEDGGLGYLILKDVDRLMPLAEAMARYQPERVNPPGVQTAYSNYATALAGLVVARASATDFTEYVENNIFTPLGMSHSTFREPLPPPLDAQMATAYSWEGGAYKPEPFELISNFGPAGALSASGADMGRFMLALLNGGDLEGGRILRPETLEQMLTRQFGHDDRLAGMGLGFYENRLNGVRWLGHGGDTFYFHSNLGLDLENRVGFFVSFGGAGGADVRTAFTEAFARRFYPEAAGPVRSSSEFSERAAEYEGNYLFWRANFSTLEKLGGLLGGISVAAVDDGLRVGERRFVEVGPDLFEVRGEPDFLYSRLAFQRDDRGRVSGFVFENLPFMSTYRAPAYMGLSWNGPLLLLALVAFIAVLLRRFYQRRDFRQLGAAERRAGRAAVVTASLNLFFAAALALLLLSYGTELFSGLPTVIVLVLLFPMLASAAALYQVYQTVQVWRGGLGSVWQRLRYSGVTLLALYMVWFYAFWNLLGFQYMS